VGVWGGGFEEIEGRGVRSKSDTRGDSGITVASL
jgi:hypothetical protein